MSLIMGRTRVMRFTATVTLAAGAGQNIGNVAINNAYEDDSIWNLTLYLSAAANIEVRKISGGVDYMIKPAADTGVLHSFTVDLSDCVLWIENTGLVDITYVVNGIGYPSSEVLNAPDA